MSNTNLQTTEGSFGDRFNPSPKFPYTLLTPSPPPSLTPSRGSDWVISLFKTACSLVSALHRWPRRSPTQTTFPRLPHGWFYPAGTESYRARKVDVRQRLLLTVTKISDLSRASCKINMQGLLFQQQGGMFSFLPSLFLNLPQ